MAGIRSSRDVIIRTDRWAAALRFYEAVLGFPARRVSTDIAGFDTGAVQLFVERGSPHGPVFDFLVDDVAATRDRLVAAGCTLIEEDPAVPRCYLRDPFGLVFNLGRSATS
jgi:catechol 2,3-dioxygenase-like lactoylglutathione lyase family enzyme